jgi:crotonobetainyl-CoA:carnitine CoA-transferase CaiB-like acyl-CoA transferase
LHGLGIAPADVLADRTDAVWVDITAYPPDPSGDTGVGFGDDVAMAAGLVRWRREVPIPCGDALADPLTGVHGALAALAAYRAGGRHHITLSLFEVAASTVAPVPERAVERAGRGWVVTGEQGVVAVRRPRARAPRGTARPLGIDTDRVLHQ